MAQFVIIGIVGRDRKYLASDNSWYWTSKLSDANIFSTQKIAESVLECITEEGDSQSINCKTTETIWTAPRTLRSLAELDNSKNKAEVKISIAVIDIVPLNIQRWHIEDGNNKTKRLN